MISAKQLASFGAVMVLSAMSAAPVLAQGETGFLRGQSHFDVALTYNRDSFDHFWIGNDRVHADPVGRITRQTYSAYGAFGVTDDIDLTFSGNWVTATSSENLPRNSDPQDGTVRVKWRAMTLREGTATWSLLLAPGIKRPLDEYEENDVTAIGDGQTDYLGRVIGHLQFDNGLYFSLETGYDKRAGLPRDEYPVNLTFGYTFADRITVSPFISRVYPQGGTNIGEGPFPGNRERTTRAGVSAYVRVTENFGVTASWRTTLSGENTGEFEGYTVGAVFKF